MNKSKPLADNRWLHRSTVLIVCLVWPLIWVGGLVTTYDAGMAVPDWPNTYGNNLFLYPYQTWLLGPFDLFIEHGHRLLGALVGFVAIAAVIFAWTCEARRWVRWLTFGLLLAVIFQGVLGGLRVVLGDRTLAMVHGCTAPLVFALSVGLTVITGRWWQTKIEPEAVADVRLNTAKREGSASASGPPSNVLSSVQPKAATIRMAAALTVFAYGQLILGAQLRHVQATSSPGGFTHLVYTHVALAFLLLLLAVWLRLRLRPLPDDGCGDLTLLRRGSLVVGFITVQIALGFGTWIANYGIPVFAQWNPAWASYLVKSKAFTESLVTTAHVATGSLILALALVLWLRLGRARFIVQ